MSEYGLHLLPQHARLLEESAITPEVARERGYVSVDTRKRLESAGFARYQRQVPGLLVPVHDATGAIALYQYRPDSPRVNKGGKPVKYETPGGSRMVLDVPVRIRGQLGDPGVPLWVTEGARKADAAVSAGLCCVALLGVSNYRGRNDQGGLTALAAWNDVALNGRRVYIAFDSDVMTKKSVHSALAGIGAYLAHKQADVRYVYLPHGDDGKTGLDDYLAAGGSADELVTTSEPAPREPAPPPAAAAQAEIPLPEWDGDAAGLLDDLADWLLGYVAFPVKDAVVAVTLWIAHTHLSARFESTPRLALLSPEKQCGKSRVLELVELTAAAAEVLSDASPAYIYRRIGAGPVTILLDEADAIWKRGRSADETAEALRSVINAGHRKSATVGRVEMNGQAAKLTRFRVYAPAAIAGIGNLPDTILDRSVIIRMRRRAPDETVRSYRERITRPEGEALRERLAAWAGSVNAIDTYPEMPEGVTDRPADVWEPLLMVADLAGGAWPHLAREACTALLGAQSDDTATAGIRLLADIRAVWASATAATSATPLISQVADVAGVADKAATDAPSGVTGTPGTSGTLLASQVPDVPGVPHMATDELLRKLRNLDESPWGDWYGRPLEPRGLAKLLKPYGIAPAKVRIGEDSVRGYRRADFADAWKRYL